MLGLLNRKPRPEEAIGPDGMTDFSREMRRQWKLRDEAMEKIHDVIAERTGIDRDLIMHLPPEYLTIAVLLGIKAIGE